MNYGFESRLNQYDIIHCNLLVNMAHIFFDNVYQDQRYTFTQKSNFLSVFQEFAFKSIPKTKFSFDDIGNVVIVNSQVLKTV